jgi:hypothetical protein
MVMLVPGFFLILLVGWILDQLFIEEADADSLAGSAGVVEAKPAAATGGAGAAEQPLVIEIPRRRPPQQQSGAGDGDASKGGA